MARYYRDKRCAIVKHQDPCRPDIYLPALACHIALGFITRYVRATTECKGDLSDRLHRLHRALNAGNFGAEGRVK